MVQLDDCRGAAAFFAARTRKLATRIRVGSMPALFALPSRRAFLHEVVYAFGGIVGDGIERSLQFHQQCQGQRIIAEAYSASRW